MKGGPPSLTAARSQTRVHADSLGPCRPSKGHAPSREHAAAARTPRASSRERARAHAHAGGPPSRHSLSARPPHPTHTPSPRLRLHDRGCCEPATGSHFKAELEVTGERAGSGVQSRLSALAAAEWPVRRSRRLQPATPRPSSLPCAPTSRRGRCPGASALRLGSCGRFSQAAGSGKGLRVSSAEPIRDPSGDGGQGRGCRPRSRPSRIWGDCY